MTKMKYDFAFHEGSSSDYFKTRREAMLDIKYILANPETVQINCKNRRVKVEIVKVIESYQQKNATAQELQQLRQRQNEIAQQIPKEKSVDSKKRLIEEGRSLKDRIAELEKKFHQQESIWLELMQQLPNLTHPEVPQGGEEDGRELRQVGKIPLFSFTPKNHLELAQNLDLVDFDAGADVSGQKFYFLKNQAVFLELGLIRYALDIAVKHGFSPTITPDLAKTEIVEGTGYYPRGNESQIYNIEGHDLCLIGTSEITIGGMLRNKIIDIKDLPLKIAGISHCFRTEAGALGRESKGLYRVHQFSKVELFIFSLPEESEKMHEEILAIEEEIFQGLELPYRVIDIASGDLGNPAFRKFDIEAWMPGRGSQSGSYGEVTSTSNCTDFQARRLGIRYRDSNGKTNPVHTLNGTAIAISRALVALLENGQQEDGSILIPNALIPYCGFDRICQKK